MKSTFLSSLLFVLFPVTLLAAVTDAMSAEVFVLTLLMKLGYFLWLLALAMFFWGLIKFIKNAADTKEHEEGKHLIVWGLISVLVLISLWAIVKIVLVDSLGINAAKVCYVDKNGVQICP